MLCLVFGTHYRIVHGSIITAASLLYQAWSILAHICLMFLVTHASGYCVVGKGQMLGNLLSWLTLEGGINQLSTHHLWNRVVLYQTPWWRVVYTRVIWSCPLLLHAETTLFTTNHWFYFVAGIKYSAVWVSIIIKPANVLQAASCSAVVKSWYILQQADCYY